jgi:peptide/nickel transport system substrate-binding protein
MAADLYAAAASPYKPEGEMRWALCVTLSPSWFDPGEVVGLLTPFWALYAMHDAVVKPMPGDLMTPSLAESWTVSADQRVYEFKLRQGLTFHNAIPSLLDVVASARQGSQIYTNCARWRSLVPLLRFQLAGHAELHGLLQHVGGGGELIVEKYVEQVGDEGFRKHPIGLGPYKFVSYRPGVELILEAVPSYWRKVPHVKRLVFKSVPEATTRLAMLKKGEVDVAYLLDAPLAEEVKRDPTLKLAFSGGIGIFFLDFFDQWDPKSPWHDKRVRLAASYAIDRQALSESETLGASKPTGNIIPTTFDFACPSRTVCL